MTTVVTKGSDESRANSTLAADSELVVPLTSGVYRIRGFIPWTAAATPDMKMGAYISGSTYVWAAGRIRTEQLGFINNSFAIAALAENNLATMTARLMAGSSGYSTAFAKAALDIMLRVEGDGEFQIVWAQNTTDAGQPTIVRGDARLVYERVDTLNYLEYAVLEADHILYANSSFADVPGLSIELEPNTGYAIEACLICGSGTWGRTYEAKFCYDGDIGVAHTRTDACEGGSPTRFTTSTCSSQVREPDGILVAGAEPFSGSGAAGSSERGAQHHQGYLFTGEAGGTLKVQSYRWGSNPGGTARMFKGSWISAEKLPPC